MRCLRAVFLEPKARDTAEALGIAENIHVGKFASIKV
jgi:hypothetical protein